MRIVYNFFKAIYIYKALFITKIARKTLPAKLWITRKIDGLEAQQGGKVLHILVSEEAVAPVSLHLNMMMGVVRSALWVAAVLLPSVVGQCDTNLNAIRLREINADTSVQRTYTICPGTELQIGTLDPNKGNELTGNTFFQAKTNLRIQCGPDGSSANNCTVIGGTIQVDGTDFLGNTEPAYNFELSGFTFVDTDRYNYWGNMPGSITFFDCIFRVSLLFESKQRMCGTPRLILTCLPFWYRITRKQWRQSWLIILTLMRVMSLPSRLSSASSW